MAGFRVPDGARRIRLVYLPEQPARREVMIIYLESPAATTPAAGTPGWLLGRAEAAIRLVRGSRP